MSDILKDSTATLEAIIAECQPGARTDHATLPSRVLALVRHMQAGGEVPEQLRGKGTAVGALLEETAGCVRVFKQEGIYYAPRLAARLIHVMGDVLGEETRAWRSDSPAGTEGTTE